MCYALVVVASDINSIPSPCANCGYDLRGTCEQGRCPECGWRFLAGAVLVKVFFRDDQPNGVGTLIAALLWLLTVAIVVRSPGIVGIEFWGSIGLLLFLSFVLFMYGRQWWCFLRTEEEHSARTVLMLTGNDVSVWRNGREQQRIAWRDVESLRLRRFLITCYLIVTDSKRNKIDVRLKADPQAIAVLRELFQRMLKQRN